MNLKNAPQLDLQTPDNGRGSGKAEGRKSDRGLFGRIGRTVSAAAAGLIALGTPNFSEAKNPKKEVVENIDHDIKRAKDLYGDGTSQYEDGKFDKAIRSFEAALALLPPDGWRRQKIRSRLFWNIARAQFNSGLSVTALASYKKALAELPDENKPEDGATADEINDVRELRGDINAAIGDLGKLLPVAPSISPPGKSPVAMPNTPVTAPPIAPAPVPVTPIPVAPAPEPAKPPEPIPGGNKGEGKEGRLFEKSVGAALYAAVGRNIGNNGAVEGKGGVLGALRLRQQDSNNAGEVSLSYALGRSPVNARGDDGVVAEAATRIQAVQVGGAYVRELVRNGKLSLGVYVEGRGGLLWRSPAQTEKGRDTLAGFGLTGELQTGIEGGYALDPIKGHVVVLRARLGTALSATHQFSGGPENGSADFASVMQALSIGVDVE